MNAVINFDDFSSLQKEIFKTVFKSNSTPTPVIEKPAEKTRKRSATTTISRKIQKSKALKHFMFSSKNLIKRENLERVIRRIKGDFEATPVHPASMPKNIKTEPHANYLTPQHAKKPLKRLEKKSSEKRSRGRPRKYPVGDKKNEDREI
jgi:hypothetical protein